MPDIIVQSHSGQNALHYAAFKFVPYHSTFIFDCLFFGIEDQQLIDTALLTRDENGYSPVGPSPIEIVFFLLGIYQF